MTNETNPIPPELQPERWAYLNPLNLGRFNTEQGLGWETATNRIITDILNAGFCENVIEDQDGLQEVIVKAFEDNLISDDTLENDAVQLAKIVISTMQVLGCKFPGIPPFEPPEDIEEFPPVDIPVEGDPETPPPRIFPPPILRDPGNGNDTETPRTPPPEDTPPRVRPTVDPPPEIERDPQRPEIPRSSPPTILIDTGGGDDEVDSDNDPDNGDKEDNGDSGVDNDDEPDNGDKEEDTPKEPLEVSLSIDYNALSDAMFNALKRFHALSKGDPFRTDVTSTDEQDDSMKARQDELLDQVALMKSLVPDEVEGKQEMEEKAGVIYTTPDRFK